jgi:hypothetical protein
VLAPAVELAVVEDVVALLAVVADGGEVRRRRIERDRPQIQIDRLARRAIRPAIERHAAVRRPNVLGVGDDQIVARKGLARVLVAIGQSQLRCHGIGFHVDAFGRLHVFLA